MMQQVKIVRPEDFRPTPGAAVSVDFETLYDSAYSVRAMGVWPFTHDARFHAWAVAVTDGLLVCACEPARFPWAAVEGLSWVSHNREFDKAVFERLQRDGAVPAGCGPREWFDTAAACAFLQYPRDLKGACLAVLGETVDKSARAEARGRHGSDDLFAPLGMSGAEALYVATDAVMALRLWEKVGPRWPAHERRLFEATCAMGARGLPVDWGMVEKARGALGLRLRECTAAIPWTPHLSVPKFEEACRTAGVTPPATTAQSDENFGLWLKEHEGKPCAAWASAMSSYRRANRLLSVLDAMESRRTVGGRMVYELKYFGATPGRWSGGGGLNVQNFNRKEAEGLDVRKCVRASAGHVLAVLDYSQIEARVLLWLAGDEATLRMLKDHPEMDMYEVHARATMGYRYEEPLEKFCERTGSTFRQLAKARVLGLGFRCGAGTFVRVAKIMAKLVVSFEGAKRIVDEYRRSNPLVVQLWEDLERRAREAYEQGVDFVLPFPCTEFDPRCGRYLFYRDIQPGVQLATGKRGMTAIIAGERQPLHGGILAENLTQGTARDVMASAWLRCEAAGYFPILSVHDELVFELPEAGAKGDLEKIRGIMEAPLAWVRGLPLKASGKLMSRYGK